MAQLHLTYSSRKQLEHIPKYTETKTMKYDYNYRMIYTPRLVGDVEFRSNTFEYIRIHSYGQTSVRFLELNRGCPLGY